MDTGFRLHRSYMPIKFGTQIDAKYGFLYPVFRKMMYPGDVFKIHADLLIRYQPMMAPPMNDCKATVRFAFVPLRLVESEIELIMTGSEDGHVSTETLPVCDSCYKKLDISEITSIQKGSILDILYQIPAGLTLTNELKAKLENSKSSPAAYFDKAYCRFWWDYYRDENLYIDFTEFDDFVNDHLKKLHLTGSLLSSALPKDRVTSSLPWQLKAAVIPRVEILAEGMTSTRLPLSWQDSDPESPGFETAWISSPEDSGSSDIQGAYDNESVLPFRFKTDKAIAEWRKFDHKMNERLETGFVPSGQPVTIQTAGFAGSDLREVMAQTSIYERLARCGSRYTEYLRANFGVAPSDGTLQRAQYLGGFKTPIITPGSFAINGLIVCIPCVIP